MTSEDSATNQNDSAIRILIVEDEALIAFDIRDALASQGFSIIALPSAKEALDFIQTNEPDLVILDVRLDDGDCGSIALALRSKNIPWIIYSACDPMDSIVPEIIRMSAWITKPGTISDILTAVSIALNRGPRAASSSLEA